jgi:hypothetical protein
VVRWLRREGFAVENGDIEPQTHAQFQHHVTRLAQRMDSITAETVERKDASTSETSM